MSYPPKSRQVCIGRRGSTPGTNRTSAFNVQGCLLQNRSPTSRNPNQKREVCYPQGCGRKPAGFVEAVKMLGELDHEEGPFDFPTRGRSPSDPPHAPLVSPRVDTRAPAVAVGSASLRAATPDTSSWGDPMVSIYSEGKHPGNRSSLWSVQEVLPDQYHRRAGRLLRPHRPEHPDRLRDVRGSAEPFRRRLLHGQVPRPGDNADPGGLVQLWLTIDGIRRGSLGAQEIKAPSGVAQRTVSASYLSAGKGALKPGRHTVGVYARADGQFVHLSLVRDIPLVWFD